jgi:hypothetical protein
MHTQPALTRVTKLARTSIQIDRAECLVVILTWAIIIPIIPIIIPIIPIILLAEIESNGSARLAKTQPRAVGRQVDDWTITRRPAGRLVDGYASYVRTICLRNVYLWDFLPQCPL